MTLVHYKINKFLGRMLKKVSGGGIVVSMVPKPPPVEEKEVSTVIAYEEKRRIGWRQTTINFEESNNLEAIKTKETLPSLRQFAKDFEDSPKTPLVIIRVYGPQGQVEQEILVECELL